MPPRKTSLDPGIAVSSSATSPPVQDSAVASVRRRARHSSSTISATGRSSSENRYSASSPRSTPTPARHPSPTRSTWISKSRAQTVASTPLPLAARLREHARDRGLAHAVEAQRTSRRRLGPREHAPHRLALERRSPTAAAARAEARAGRPRHTSRCRGRRPAQFRRGRARRAPSGSEACFVTPGANSPYGRLQPLGDPARHALDLPLRAPSRR